jgi:alkanesulfonate monooxygenase SsuD/methylene tetrahydromethanopterin reductase-like flavin-dependent oxidoreductase (luciferase family)
MHRRHPGSAFLSRRYSELVDGFRRLAQSPDRYGFDTFFLDEHSRQKGEGALIRAPSLSRFPPGSGARFRKWSPVRLGPPPSSPRLG